MASNEHSPAARRILSLAVSAPATALLSLAVTLVALKAFLAPWLWIAGVWTLWGIVMVVRAEGTASQLLGSSVASVTLVLGLAEVWLWVHPGPPSVSLELTPQYTERTPILGWRLRRGLTSTGVERVGNAVIYRVVYHVDSLGERVTPRPAGQTPRGCAVFLIDSFTFGEGVADDQDLPYRVGVRAGGDFQVVNLGVPGYGIEHALAGLETGTLEARTRCRPTHFIYQAIQDHVRRAAGLVDFAHYGPRYVLGDNGSVRYVGTPERTPPKSVTQRLMVRVREQLDKSRLVSAIEAREPRPSAADLRLYLALVRRTKELLAANYPGAEFDVLLWNHAWLVDSPRQLHDGLVPLADRLFVVDDILPEYRTSRSRYELNARDAHPNALAYDILAAFVVDSILRQPTPGRCPSPCR